jgi:hypothetical protein
MHVGETENGRHISAGRRDTSDQIVCIISWSSSANRGVRAFELCFGIRLMPGCGTVELNCAVAICSVSSREERSGSQEALRWQFFCAFTRSQDSS